MSDNPDNKTPLDRVLGMDRKITRQDFLGSTLLASGAVLLGKSPEQILNEGDWTGYGGVGDYSNSNGNTWEVVTSGHKIRDRVFETLPGNVTDTGEEFESVVVGGGISGLAAALALARQPGSRARTCLVLDNHPVFGGEAKRNEFKVNGQRLIAHQGSAMCFPPLPNTFLADFYPSIGIDFSKFKYQTWAGSDPKLPLPNTPYVEGDKQNGFYFGAKFGHPEGLWVIDPWGSKLKDAPIPDNVRAEWLRVHAPVSKDVFEAPKQHGDAVSRQLDSITLEQHICKVHQVSPEFVRAFVSPLAGGGSGLGADALSAYCDYAADVLFPWNYDADAQMFPGGNAGVARHMVKALNPDAIPGPATLENICRTNIRFSTLDRPGIPTRLRLEATIMSVRHDGPADRARFVNVVYLKGGKLYRVKARSVIMAGGSWTTKHIVRDLPETQSEAYAQFHRAPCLMANVALTNWRFLYRLGINGCQWFEGIGNYSAVRKTVTFGPEPATIDPDQPVILTLKILFSKPGLPLQSQVVQGRTELLATPFRNYERQIREQFTQMFGKSGFDARRDIAGIILNRWGHAYLAPQPGFFFGSDAKPAPGDVLRQNPYGRIAFANSDLTGIMDHRASIAEGYRAAHQAAAVIG